MCYDLLAVAVGWTLQVHHRRADGAMDLVWLQGTEFGFCKSTVR